MEVQGENTGPAGKILTSCLILLMITLGIRDRWVEGRQRGGGALGGYGISAVHKLWKVHLHFKGLHISHRFLMNVKNVKFDVFHTNREHRPVRMEFCEKYSMQRIME